ncbi:MAG: hypothetical protein NC489_41755, partial [Ruminococcus flavefaciens]|nr:hypothetical protein [Ruminococcus flavefaciens]
HVTFTAHQDGFYEFTKEDAAAAASVRALTGDDISVTYKLNSEREKTASFPFKLYLTAGDTIRLEITNGGSASASFTVKAATSQIGEVPQNEDIVLLRDSDTYYKYKVTEEGTYTFRMTTSFNYYLAVSIYESESDCVNGTNELGSCTSGISANSKYNYDVALTDTLAAGKEIYIRLKNENRNSDETVTFTATKTSTDPDEGDGGDSGSETPGGDSGSEGSETETE